MNVLAVIHQDEGRPGVFREVIAGRGHRLEEWSFSWPEPPPRRLDDYGAVLVFGGEMHADQDGLHPWLREEDRFLRRLLERRVPVLGICLGAQLLARAAEAQVGPASEPEIGWVPVELTERAVADPLFGGLPERFEALQWHYYAYDVPAGAQELARSRVCSQAFRLGDAAWGIQFHPEVTVEDVQQWVDNGLGELPHGGRALLADTRRLIGVWNALGRHLCSAFLEAAEQIASSTRPASRP